MYDRHGEMAVLLLCCLDAASVGSSSASEKGTGSGRSSPAVRDKKLFKGTGAKKDVSSLGMLTLANQWDISWEGWGWEFSTSFSKVYPCLLK